MAESGDGKVTDESFCDDKRSLLEIRFLESIGGFLRFEEIFRN